MRRVAMLMAVAAWVVGCGPSNTPVSVGGKTLQPKSALMFNILFPGLNGTIIAVTDAADVCGSMNTSACQRNFMTVQSGTSLTLMIPGIEPGEFPVGLSENFSQAQIEFSVTEGGKETFSQRATSGTVTLEAAELNRHASGRYEVTFEDGTKASGSFVADYCEKLKDYKFGGGMSCQFGGSATSCDGSCTCEQQTVKAECTRSDEQSAWACTCTSPSGTQSSCSMPASAGSDQACGEGQSCCPLAF